MKWQANLKSHTHWPGSGEIATPKCLKPHFLNNHGYAFLCKLTTRSCSAKFSCYICSLQCKYLGSFSGVLESEENVFLPLHLTYYSAFEPFDAETEVNKATHGLCFGRDRTKGKTEFDFPHGCDIP